MIHCPRHPPQRGPAAPPRTSRGRPITRHDRTTPDDQFIADWPLLHHNGGHDFVTSRKSGVLISSHHNYFTGRLQTPTGVTFGAARGRHERRQSQSAAAPPPPPRSGGLLSVISVIFVNPRTEHAASAYYLLPDTSMPRNHRILQDSSLRLEKTHK